MNVSYDPAMVALNTLIELLRARLFLDDDDVKRIQGIYQEAVEKEQVNFISIHYESANSRFVMSAPNPPVAQSHLE